MIARLARWLMTLALIGVAAGPAAACRAPAPVAKSALAGMANCHGMEKPAPDQRDEMPAEPADCCTAMCAGLAASAVRVPMGLAPVALARTATIVPLAGLTPELERPPPRAAA